MITDTLTLPCLGADATAEAADGLSLRLDSGADAFARYRTTRNEQAFHEVIRTYLPAVRHICRRILGSSPLCEDAVQETFIKAARHADSVTGAPGPWIRACAANAALSLRRSERARRLREQVYAVDARRSEQDSDEAPWEQSVVLSCLSLLGEQDRQVLVEHFLLGRSQTEIAGALGISQVAVHKRVQRALAALRLRVVAAGASEGLATLAGQSAGRDRNGALVIDPYTWLLIAVASSDRGRFAAVLMAPLRALVSALTLEERGPRYYASSVRRSLLGRGLWWSYAIGAELALHLDPRTWRRTASGTR
jgi:RNA polymerase sigma-70 factor (ECF subfamily)